MAQIEKLIERLKSKPKDFTYNEAKRLFGYFGYQEFNKGTTSGSRISFVNEEKDIFCLHKPHPKMNLKIIKLTTLFYF